MAALPPTVDALARRLGLDVAEPDEVETARAEDALDDAAQLALAEALDAVAEAWRADAPAVVRLVVLRAARREYENPRGLTEETLGEHSVGLSHTPGVYLTQREVALMHRVAAGRRGGFVGSIRTTSVAD